VAELFGSTTPTTAGKTTPAFGLDVSKSTPALEAPALRGASFQPPGLARNIWPGLRYTEQYR
jgi:hypothetical protein